MQPNPRNSSASGVSDTSRHMAKPWMTRNSCIWYNWKDNWMVNLKPCGVFTLKDAHNGEMMSPRHNIKWRLKGNVYGNYSLLITLITNAFSSPLIPPENNQTDPALAPTKIWLNVCFFLAYNEVQIYFTQQYTLSDLDVRLIDAIAITHIYISKLMSPKSSSCTASTAHMSSTGCSWSSWSSSPESHSTSNGRRVLRV